MSKKRILVVEDDKETIELIRMVLETKNYEVIPAYDGDEALAKAHEEKPDLIILDVLLPRVNGFRICRILKEDFECKSIPILILTAVTEESMRDDEYWKRRSGADDYITKPFEILDLLERVERLFEIAKKKKEALQEEKTIENKVEVKKEEKAGEKPEKKEEPKVEKPVEKKEERVEQG